jgi:hypothetical protein
LCRYEHEASTVCKDQTVSFYLQRLYMLGGGFGGKKESGQLRFGGRDRPFKKPLPVPGSKIEREARRSKD